MIVALEPVADEKKKRGRKKPTDSQPQPQEQQAQPQPQPQPQPHPQPQPQPQPHPQPQPQPQSQTNTSDIAIVPPKKKRVNKKKIAEHETFAVPAEEPDIVPAAEEPAPDLGGAVVASHKKRGRKPKGGKVIQQLTHELVSMPDAPNIILHLKCSVSDIPDYDATLTGISIKPGDVVSFNALESKGADLNDSYQSMSTGAGSNFIINDATKKSKSTPDALIATNSYNHLNNSNCEIDDDDDDEPGSCDKSLKDIWKKLNHLKLCFHKSDVFQNIGVGARRSCCFWDTCDFDTPPVYIPKCITQNGGYTVYGCFCSPECALAYLMNEGVDTSVKFERCQMLNSMYGKLLNYDKSIKPAPNPQYILNKFYGNLSIQEYRKLFKSEQIIYVVNKPLTHILPEMYEDNNDFLLNNKVIPNNNYKLKKKTSVFG
jgi:hypothetical protein